MTGAQALALLYDSPFGVAARQVKGVFSILETVHFIGLCILFGAIMVFDLRLLGVTRRGTLRSALRYTHVAAFGLSLNAVSGFVLFASKPTNYLTNPAFQLKMLFLALALFNVVWFELVEKRKVMALAAGEDAAVESKLVAGLSLAFWLAVLVLGRWLPVTALGGG